MTKDQENQKKDSVITKKQESTTDQNSQETNQEKQQIHSQQEKKLLLIFIVALIIGICLIYFSPKLSIEEKERLFKLPQNAAQLRQIRDVLMKYSEQNFYYVASLFAYSYTFCYSFCLPLHAFLSILSGSIYGFLPGFILVCLCSTIGTSFSYFLVKTFGKNYITKKFPERLSKLKMKVKENKNNLLWYMLFLRFTPLFPNWFVTLASPIIGFNFKIFLIGTFIGLMPVNFIQVNMGVILQDIDKLGMNFYSILVLILLGFASLIPTLFTKKCKIDEQSKSSQTNENQKLKKN